MALIKSSKISIKTYLNRNCVVQTWIRGNFERIKVETPILRNFSKEQTQNLVKDGNFLAWRGQSDHCCEIEAQDGINFVSYPTHKTCYGRS